MAHFRAVITGASGGEASRLGTFRTGVRAVVQSFGWDIEIVTKVTDGGKDWAHITLINHTTGDRRSCVDVNMTDGKTVAAE